MSNVSMPIPTEAQEAEVLVAYLRIKNHKFTHIGNETGHSPEALRRAVRLKRQGVSRGFPDYLIIVNHQLIAVELKRHTRVHECQTYRCKPARKDFSH